MKDTIKKFSSKTMTTSYAKLAIADTHVDSQGKRKIIKII